MDKILTLLDGSGYSESVCHHTAWIAQKLNASVIAMHVLGRREGAASTDLDKFLVLVDIFSKDGFYDFNLASHYI